MEVTELTESMLNDMSEHASSLSQILDVIKWLKFDGCYNTEHAISDLWDVVIDSMLDLKKHL